MREYRVDIVKILQEGGRSTEAGGVGEYAREWLMRRFNNSIK